MRETIDELIMDGCNSGSNSNSDSSTRSHSNTNTSSSQRFPAMNRRPAAIKETQPVYSDNTLSVHTFEGSTSTLGANDAGQQKSRNKLVTRINQNSGATMDTFTDFF